MGTIGPMSRPHLIKSDTTSICLAQTQPNQLPFISALEVRSLDSKMYGHVDPDYALFVRSRVAYGANKTVSFPDDRYDRIWVPARIGSGLISVASDAILIDVANAPDNPPREVLKNAITTSFSPGFITLNPGFRDQDVSVCMNLYFSEVTVLDSTQKRSFNAYIDCIKASEPIIPPYGEATELVANFTASANTSISLVSTNDSTLPPLINAVEIFYVSVPKLTKNLLSVSHLTDQYPVNCEFSNRDFYVKERETGQPVMRGRRKGDLYVLPTSPDVLPTSPELYFSHRYKSTSAEVWHQRLGHPQSSALQLLKNKGLINIVGTIKSQHICDSCQLGKLSRLPFTKSENSRTEQPVDTNSCQIPLLPQHLNTLDPLPVTESHNLNDSHHPAVSIQMNSESNNENEEEIVIAENEIDLPSLEISRQQQQLPGVTSPESSNENMLENTENDLITSSLEISRSQRAEPHEIVPSQITPQSLTGSEAENPIDPITISSDTSLSQRLETHGTAQETPPLITETAESNLQRPETSISNPPGPSVHSMLTRSRHGIITSMLNLPVEGLGELQKSFSVLQEIWSGDPCLPSAYTWDRISCSNDVIHRVTAL
ncbi:hypothetical protein SADUNF_Sadunf05G0024300 [Salix dunnii]|uniref:GAG-pre-integrase domain-containing protein n=1 Tax=Salix dunnii TaxID=1413687 RepID=A0A835MWN4_9ROSI|nr:hypothetical protein SADUNF_Sadunf05G0024300 [Salix dunnii]